MVFVVMSSAVRLLCEDLCWVFFEQGRAAKVCPRSCMKTANKKRSGLVERNTSKGI